MESHSKRFAMLCLTHFAPLAQKALAPQPMIQQAAQIENENTHVNSLGQEAGLS